MLVPIVVADNALSPNATFPVPEVITDPESRPINMLEDTLLNISTTGVSLYCNSIVEYPSVLTTNLLVGETTPTPTLPFLSTTNGEGSVYVLSSLTLNAKAVAPVWDVVTFNAVPLPAEAPSNPTFNALPFTFELPLLYSILAKLPVHEDEGVPLADISKAPPSVNAVDVVDSPNIYPDAKDEDVILKAVELVILLNVNNVEYIPWFNVKYSWGFCISSHLRDCRYLPSKLVVKSDNTPVLPKVNTPFTALKSTEST